MSARMGYMGTHIIGCPLSFQEAVNQGFSLRADLLVCGVDNDGTRVFASKYALQHDIPAIFTAVSTDANHGYVLVQEAGGPCFGCLFPESISNDKSPCPGVPAVKDILKTVSGLVLYAADTILMERKRNWNYRTIYLAGFQGDMNWWLKPRRGCPLCSSIMQDNSDEPE